MYVITNVLLTLFVESYDTGLMFTSLPSASFIVADAIGSVPVVPSAYTRSIFPPVRSMLSPWLYFVFVGAVIVIPVTTFDSVIFSVACALFAPAYSSVFVSVYVTVKFCVVVLVALYPDTIVSTRSTGVCCPADAYVTVYLMLLAVIISVNVSLYFPVTVSGFIVIPVT